MFLFTLSNDFLVSRSDAILLIDSVYTYMQVSKRPRFILRCVSSLRFTDPASTLPRSSFDSNRALCVHANYT